MGGSEDLVAWLEDVRPGFGVHVKILEEYGIGQVQDLELFDADMLKNLEEMFAAAKVPPFHVGLIIRAVKAANPMLETPSKSIPVGVPQIESQRLTPVQGMR
jgi:hypothetical protein